MSEVDSSTSTASFRCKPEVDEAVNDVIHEMVIKDEDEKPVDIDVGALVDLQRRFQEQVRRNSMLFSRCSISRALL